jgi:hypothetical protein
MPRIILTSFTLISAFLVTATSQASQSANETARVYPAPASEPLSQRFKVTVNGLDAPVYIAHVSSVGEFTPRSAKATDSSNRLVFTSPYLHAAKEQFTDGEAAFAQFDISAPVQIVVTSSEAVQKAKILPSASGVVPKIMGNQIIFSISKPSQLTLEINGDWNNSLNLFANNFETHEPNPRDPNVIYFGPGAHTITSMKIPEGKQVYLAGGAVVYGSPGPDGKNGTVLDLSGDNIKVRGRGVLDGSLLPKTGHGGSLVGVHGNHVEIEGIILRDSCTWNVPIRHSTDVKVSNIKIFGWRGNSDGVDIVNSQNVDVRDSFFRTFDDLVVVKTNEKGGPESRDITAERLVLWNELAHALKVGAELQENVENVTFSDSDIIHDKGHDWLLRVFNGGSGTVQHVTYDNIRIEEDRRPFSLWIGRTKHNEGEDVGHINGVIFRNIQAIRPELDHPAFLVGFDPDHTVEDVSFENVTLGGRPLKASDIEQDEFVRDVKVTP